MPSTMAECPRGTREINVQLQDDSGYDTATTVTDHTDHEDGTINVAMRVATPIVEEDNMSEWAASQCSGIEDGTPLPDASDIFNINSRRSSSDSSDYEDFINRLGCRRWPMGICTMPRLNGRNSPTKAHPRPSLKSFYSGSSANQSTGSLRSPDRFLASADNLDATVQKFRMNKDAMKLSPAERLLRNDNASPDAFSSRRSFTTPAPPAMGNRRSSASARPGGELTRCMHSYFANLDRCKHLDFPP